MSDKRDALIIQLVDELLWNVNTVHHDLAVKALREIGMSDQTIKLYFAGEVILDSAQPTPAPASAPKAGVTKIQGVFLESFRALHNKGTQLHSAQITYLFSLADSLQAERDDLRTQLAAAQRLLSQTPPSNFFGDTDSKATPSSAPALTVHAPTVDVGADVLKSVIADLEAIATGMTGDLTPANVANIALDKLNTAPDTSALKSAVKPFADTWQQWLDSDDYTSNEEPFIDWLQATCDSELLEANWRQLAAAALTGGVAGGE